jgi:DNA-binding transcriptional ArsR family regulator
LTKPKSVESFEALQEILPALAHTSRRQILMITQLRGGEMSAGDIAELFVCTWATTSRHLQVLVRAGLLIVQRRGRKRLYRLNRARLVTVESWLAWFRRGPNSID